MHRLITQAEHPEETTVLPTKRRQQQYVEDHKIGRLCQHCGQLCTNENVSAFDFDHIGDGEISAAIYKLINGSDSNFHDKIEAEMGLTQLLCGNCHYLKTFHYSIHEGNMLYDRTTTTKEVSL